MANNEELGKDIDANSDLPVVSETKAPASSKTKPEAAPKPKSQALLWFVVLLTLLLVLGMAGAAYWWLMNRTNDNQALIDAQQTQQARLVELDAQNLELQSQLQSLEQSKGELSEAVSNLMSRSEALQRQTDAALAQLNDLDGRRPADWLIAEADYLVRMAGRKVWLERDIRTAIMLLGNADKRLQELSDPSVLPVRALIAQDIQTLQQVNPVSQTSVALALAGMLPQVEKLPLDTFVEPEADNTEDTQVSESAADWKDNLYKVWRSLVDDFITVKTIEGPVTPIMSQQQQWLVREQLKLQLMQAQSAALDHNLALYQQSLQNALALLIEKYDIDATQVSGFATALQNLIETDISQEVPTELASQQPLEQLLGQRVKKVFGQGGTAL